MTKKQLREIRDTGKEIQYLRETTKRLRETVGPSDKIFTLEAKLMKLVDSYVLSIERFESELNRLSPNERIVMRAYYIDTLSWNAVAESTHYSESAVYQMRRSALEIILSDE